MRRIRAEFGLARPRGVLRTHVGGTAISRLTFSHHSLEKVSQDMSIMNVTELGPAGWINDAPEKRRKNTQ